MNPPVISEEELERIKRQFREASGCTAAEAAAAFEAAAKQLNLQRDPHINATLLHGSPSDDTT